MIFLISVFSVLVVVFIILFNKFISLRVRVKEAWSDVEVQLKKRFDLINALVEVVKGYASYEQKVLLDTTTIRSANLSSAPLAASENSGALQLLKNVFMVAENYPNLKAASTFLELQKNISDVENQIQFARRYYNGAVRDFNVAITILPGLLLAGPLGYKPETFFEADEAEKLTPKVAL
jgi:LemA protein